MTVTGMSPSSTKEKPALFDYERMSGRHPYAGPARFNWRMNLTRSFAAEQFARGLESWGWIGAADKVPVFASAFGDVFFRADDGFWYLDTLAGSLTRVWADAQALEADLATPSGRDRYLLAGLAFGAESRGLIPDAGQVYNFKVPPVLGGALEVDNVETINFVVGLNIAGQLHDQIRGLPPGTRISGFTVSDETA
jgi:hypothetical protein